MKATEVWSEATVEALRALTPTVREFTLRPSGGALPAAPGSHLPVQLPVRGRAQTRCYSLIGPPQDGCYRIAVKRLDGGRGGSLAMWELAAGQRLAVGEPQNHFPLDLGAPAHLLVAGGIGVTPLVWMAQALAARGAVVHMLYGARSRHELAYFDTLQAALGDRLQARLSGQGERIAFGPAIAALPPGGRLVVCGPAPMLDAARQAWSAAGRAPADLRFETFGAGPAAEPFRVRVPRHAVEITVPADCSLLDALERAGVQTLSDCRRGECGLCAVDVLAVDGRIDHRDVFLGPAEKAANRRLCACVSRAVGTLTLDSAFRSDR